MGLRIWWKTWSELLWKLLALAGSLASMVGLLVVFLPPPVNLPSWAVGLLVFTGLCVVVLIVLEFIYHRGRHVFAKSDTEGIKKYMHDWIEHGGRVAIWTRDMSWAQNRETRSLLTEKARRGELIISLPELNSLARELRNAGAEVCAYGARRLESPASRFTIAFFGRDGSAVAVGRAEGDAHVIDEFSSSSHPVFHVAEDLIALVRSLQGQQDR
jgi:hypothetical protein